MSHKCPGQSRNTRTGCFVRLLCLMDKHPPTTACGPASRRRHRGRHPTRSRQPPTRHHAPAYDGRNDSGGSSSLMSRSAPPTAGGCASSPALRPRHHRQILRPLQQRDDRTPRPRGPPQADWVGSPDISLTPGSPGPLVSATGRIPLVPASLPPPQILGRNDGPCARQRLVRPGAKVFRGQ